MTEPAQESGAMTGFASDTTEQQEPRVWQFRFEGNAAEYFGIWIVNLFLTVITLGIYSAWAKVRTQRYFYGNTLVAGSAFDYTADPVKILYGRIIAVTMLVSYQLAFTFTLTAGYVVLLLLVVFAPLIYLSSIAFRMRYSAWRGMHFGFDRDTGRAYLLFAPVMVYVVAVVFAPLLFDVSLEDLPVEEDPDAEIPPELRDFFLFNAALTFFPLLLFPLWQCFYFRFVGNRVRFGRTGFSLALKVSSFYRIYGLAFLLGFGGFMMVAFILFSMGDALVSGAAPGLVVTVVLYSMLVTVYVLVYAYYRTHMTNLIYSSIHLEKISFESTLRFAPMFFLYLTNTLGIVATLGLAIPWAKVRTVRYRAANMVMRAPDLEGFLAGHDDEIDARADAMTDIFDLDIGL